MASDVMWMNNRKPSVKRRVKESTLRSFLSVGQKECVRVMVANPSPWAGCACIRPRRLLGIRNSSGHDLEVAYQSRCPAFGLVGMVLARDMLIFAGELGERAKRMCYLCLVLGMLLSAT
jgi:hypothetical protein